MIRVLIVDDQPAMRRGLREIVRDAPEMEVAAEAGTAAQALDAARKSKPDVVLMDISMPGRSGLEALEDIKAEDPNLPVLICSIHQEKEYAVRALKAGAAGYIPKDSDPEEFISALHKVASGRRYITANLAELLAASVTNDAGGSPHEHLSNREFEVLCALGRGESITDIAHKLSLSVKTVSTYRTRVLEKLGLKGTADIIRYALDHSLAE
jgi:two-component system, NarL family, invasion response regulator UvrY